ncbi:MAG: mannose-1-phosphate guanylyltransferase/mannose-6-phosphate isomerase [Desulfobulbus propionicus]|nr:MAG: mannose-1-phosphate guanylyltransferase/mannose-6-phosphate isomerase [Desulfobulbus propionicus]
MIQPVILAGGTGSRLWPLSRELYPKQVISLIGEYSLLQNTVLRLASIAAMKAPLIVVGEEHRFMTQSQVGELGLFEDFTLLLEPLGRNTAPAICGAALYCRRHGDPEDVLLVLPADHLIGKPEAFAEAVQEAAALALAGNLVTFGIVPDHPETGYGYIARGAGHSVQSFVEKPDRATAEAYLASDTYLWNSGMFTFSLPALLQEMEQFVPEIVSTMQEAVEKGTKDGHFFRFAREAMEICPSDSIDYAVMEKTRHAAVVEADIGWSDIGSWQALWEVANKDGQGNVTSGDVMMEDVKNSLIRAEHTLVTAVGLRDTMVIETADAVLVAPMDRSQDVKKVVQRLKQQRRDEFQVHKTVYRPWGSHTTLESQERFRIKRITVKPGGKLSRQMHHHRHEHWVVVSGTARVQKDEQEILLHENESTYISAGIKHQLENPGVVPLELLEVQIGSYIGEDDIVRFDVASDTPED